MLVTIFFQQNGTIAAEICDVTNHHGSGGIEENDYQAHKKRKNLLSMILTYVNVFLSSLHVS